MGGSSNASYYPDWLIDSEVAAGTVADFLAAIEEKRGIALDKIGEANGRLREIAAILVAKPQFARFPKPDVSFWQSLASSPRESPNH